MAAAIGYITRWANAPEDTQTRTGHWMMLIGGIIAPVVGFLVLIAAIMLR